MRESLRNISVAASKLCPNFLKYHNPYFAIFWFGKHQCIEWLVDWKIIVNDDLSAYTTYIDVSHIESIGIHFSTSKNLANSIGNLSQSSNWRQKVAVAEVTLHDVTGVDAIKEYTVFIDLLNSLPNNLSSPWVSMLPEWFSVRWELRISEFLIGATQLLDEPLVVRLNDFFVDYIRDSFKLTQINIFISFLLVEVRVHCSLENNQLWLPLLSSAEVLTGKKHLSLFPNKKYYNPKLSKVFEESWRFGIKKVV